MKTDLRVDIASPEFKADPFSYYAYLRVNAPVHPVTLSDEQTAWIVTRYDDVAMVLKDERFAKDRLRVLSREQLHQLPWMPAMFKPLQRNMLDVDPPDHTRLRALVQQAFSPRVVDRMRPRIETLSHELIDRFGRRRIDLIHDYALPIPTTVIAEMLGVDARDRHKFHRWSSAILAATSARQRLFWALPNGWFFLRYLRKLIHDRRTRPREDLVSALVDAHQAGDSLSDDELLSMIFLLIIAGHETTVNLIGNGMLALLEHPDQLQKLRDDPALIKTAVEELLRFTSPVETATERFAREDVTVAGVTIPQGGLVLAALASANRDETKFENPNTLDITRDPNKHLGFGLGIHFCLGASLARLEAQIAINALLERIDDLQLAVPAESLRWRPGMVLRGLKSLPIDVRARAPVAV
ncbi:MAG: cytochrome P450 [Pirellulales bacterium]